jgi:hypothetical protein
MVLLYNYYILYDKLEQELIISNGTSNIISSSRTAGQGPRCERPYKAPTWMPAMWCSNAELRSSLEKTARHCCKCPTICHKHVHICIPWYAILLACPQAPNGQVGGQIGCHQMPAACRMAHTHGVRSGITCWCSSKVKLHCTVTVDLAGWHRNW